MNPLHFLFAFLFRYRHWQFLLLLLRRRFLLLLFILSHFSFSFSRPVPIPSWYRKLVTFVRFSICFIWFYVKYMLWWYSKRSGSFVEHSMFTIMATVHIYQPPMKSDLRHNAFFPFRSIFPLLSHSESTHAHPYTFGAQPQMHAHTHSGTRDMCQVFWISVWVCSMESTFPSLFSLNFTSNAARSSTKSAYPFKTL